MECNVDKQRFLEIMNDSITPNKAYAGCNATHGLLVIQQYLPNIGIRAAEHDTIYSATVQELVDVNISELDVFKLRDLNWMADEADPISCFV